jgi:hypothetical protein
MPSRRTVLAARPLRRRPADRAPAKRATAHAILCFLPKGLPANPLKRLLPGYELAAVQSWRAALRLVRDKAYDVYVVYAPLVWDDPLEVCRKIRVFDAHTPVILYSVETGVVKRREAATTGCIQAYLGRANDAHNLAATAAQLIMLDELRSMEAVRSRLEAIQDHIARRLARARPKRGAENPPAHARSHALVKRDAYRMYAEAGGSRANFERLWPAIYEGALKRLGSAGV